MEGKYPVGATWVAKGVKRKATITLTRRHRATKKYREMERWDWLWSNLDGFRPESNWAPSYTMASHGCPPVLDEHGKRVRFRRER